ncbi:MAG: phosphatidate cytidylyltransferase [Chloroflexi bacterium]|nr:phosphatidate cytidylyltransferase [Chloroflexota bacterium]MYE42113.1 phosphatidate cytidylyltransferase [Chloroflexota bacterium]
MRLRLATGVTGAAVVVGAIWLGAPWLTLLALAGGGLAIREYYRLTPPGVGPMPVVLGVAAVAALLLVAEAASGRDFYLASGLVLAAWTFAALLWFIACYRGGQAQTEDSLFEASDADAAPEDNAPPDDESSPYHRGTGPELNELGPYEGPWEFDANDELADSEEWDDSFSGEFEPDDDPDADAGWGQRPWLGFLFLLLGPVYIGFLLGHGLAMRDLSGGDGDLGQAWLLFTLLVVFACDTGAFAVGRLVGRHRMAPRISPNKTWEGAVGGLAASMGAALLVGLVFDLALPVWQQALIGAVASVAAQVGDLFESALKRAANVKDSGSIMPGHGGILDRMDSILFALPAVFYMLLAVGLRL